MTSRFLHRACEASWARVEKLQETVVIEAALYVEGRRMRFAPQGFKLLAAAVDALKAERARGGRLHRAWLKAYGPALLVRAPEVRP